MKRSLKLIFILTAVLLTAGATYASSCTEDNLIVNGTFETLDNWDTYGPVSLNANRLDVDVGGYAEQTFTVSHSAIYYLEFWYDTAAAGTADIRFYRVDKAHNGYSFRWTPKDDDASGWLKPATSSQISDTGTARENHGGTMAMPAAARSFW